MFIAFIYMFRATMCPSSGEIILPMRHLVFVTVYGFRPAYQTVIYIGVAYVRYFLLMMGTQLPETCREKQ